MDLWPTIITSALTLVASFGGFFLAMLSQRRADERQAARDREAAAESRALQLEDERHDFQLKTLLALQEPLRRMARGTFLVIEQDRRTIEERGTYFQLPETLDPDGFETSIEYSQHVARVTDNALRQELVAFRSLCGQFELPPGYADSLSKEEALRLQTRRLYELADATDAVTTSLGVRLRAELDRSGSQRAS